MIAKLAALVCCVVLLGMGGSALAGPPPTQTYYIPITIDEAYQHYTDLAIANQTNIITIISIVASISNTIMYYDQWENGFDDDVANPTNVWNVSNPGGTQIWGDGNPANGIPPGYASDLINAGSVIVLQTTNNYPRLASIISYDGGDKVASTKPIAITTILWPTAAGPLVAEGCEVYDTTLFGTNFFAPVGVGVYTNLSTMFSSSRLAVMASQDGTVVQVDTNADGTFDVTNTLAEGQGWFVPGEVKAGARIVASQPVEVQELTGNIGATYASRWFTLYPQEVWSSNYFTPVGASSNAYPTTVFLYNSQTNAINVSYQTLTTSGVTNVPAKGWAAFSMPTNTGGRFYSTNQTPFEAITSIDNGNDYDWGGSLVPAALLSSVASVGYGAGSSDGTANGSPVWVTAMSNTTIFVDFDGNPATGPLVDAYGNHYNTNYTVNALQSVRVFDTSGDNSQTGMRLYTTNDVKIAAMWGEDPSTAGAALPYIDAGTGILPVPVFTTKKAAQLVNDLNGNGMYDPGDGIKYTIYMNNAGLRPLTNLFLLDNLPTNTVYVPNTTTLDGAPMADDAVPTNITVYPLDEAGKSLGNINPGASRVITFQVTITNPLPLGASSITNLAQVLEEGHPFTAGQSLPIVVADLGLTKSVAPASQYVGSNVTFSIVVTNRGPNGTTNVTVQDNLPATLDYVSSSGGSYSTNTGLWTIGALNANSSTTLQITATLLVAGAITNTAQVWTSTMYDPNSIPGNSNPSEDDQSNAVVTSLAWTDLAVTKTVDTLTPTTNTVVMYTITVQNLGPTNTTGVTLSEPLTNGLTYVSNSVSQGVYSNTIGVWNIGSLAVSNSATLQIWALVSGPQDTMLTNISRITHSNLPDLNPANDQDQAQVYLSPLRISKTANVITASPGSNITYTITITNTDNRQQTGVVISDPVPTGTTYVTNTVTVTLVPALTLTNNTVSDTFSGLPSYYDNNGTTNWLGPWVEAGGDTGQNATSGLARVTNNLALVSSNTTLTRAANLLGATNVILSFSYQQGATVLTNNVRDNFGARAYNNNDGSVNWSNSWTETGDDGSATTAGNGHIFVVNPAPSRLQFQRPAANAAIERSLNLSGYTNAVLSFDWQTAGLTGTENMSLYVVSNGTAFLITTFAGTAGPSNFTTNITPYIAATTTVRFVASATVWNFGDSFYVDNVDVSFMGPMQTSNDVAFVQVSTNGTQWVNLFSNSGNFGGPFSTNYDITAYASTNTRVRFGVTNYLTSGELFEFDNPTISFWTYAPSPGQTGSPPTLASGYTLDPGQVIVVTFTAKVDNPLLYTAITNTASITTTQQPAPKSATVVTPAGNTDLAVIKTVDNSNPYAGSNVIYMIVVTNNGPATASGVQLTEPLATGLRYVTNQTSQGSYTTNNWLWNIGNVTVGSSVWLRITATVATNTAGGSYITNTSSITAMSQADNNPTNNQDQAVIMVFGVDLAIQKTANPTNPYTGGNVTYTIVVTNNGPNAATGITIADLLTTNGLSYVSSTTTTGIYNNVSGVWSNFSIAANDSETLTITALVATNTAGKTITNLCSITHVNEPELTTNNNMSTALIWPHAANLSITKRSSAAGFANPGDLVTYTIVVSNGDVTAHTGIDVTDLTPSGVTYVSGSAIVTAPLYTNLVWKDSFSNQLYSLNAGSTNFVTNWIESEANGPTNGHVQIADDSGYRPNHDLYTLSFSGAGLGVSNYIQRTANLGGLNNAVLTFDYRNGGLASNSYVGVMVSSNGFATAGTEVSRLGWTTPVTYSTTNVNISAYLSTNTTIRFFSTNLLASDVMWFDDVTITVTQRLVFTQAGGVPPDLATNFTLLPHETMTITFTDRVDNPPSVLVVTNTADVASDQMPQPNHSTVTDNVVHVDLGIMKDVNGTNSNPGTNELIGYTITLTNSGPQSASGVAITEMWPTNVVFSNAWPSAGTTYNSTNKIWTVGSLNAGSYVTLVISGRVSATSSGVHITNTVYVSSVNQYDPNPFNDTGRVTIVTLVMLTSFTAQETNGRIEVDWVTAAENGTAGFYLYRRAADESDFSLISGRLLPALMDSPQGGKYSFADAAYEPGVKYVYRLVEVETTGGQNMCGDCTLLTKGTGLQAKLGLSSPVVPSPTYTSGARTSEIRNARLALQKMGTAKAPQTKQNTSEQGGMGGGGSGPQIAPVKMALSSDGIYYVSASNVAAAAGTYESVVAAAFASGAATVTHGGSALAFLPATNGSGIYFYGQAPNSLFTTQNVYWLKWIGGRSMTTGQTAEPAQAALGGMFFDTLHFEQNLNAATAFFTDPTADYWFWDFCVAGDTGKSFVVHLDGVSSSASAPATLDVALFGATSSGIANEHHAVIKLNGTQIGEQYWQGMVATTASCSFSQSLLIDGNNTVQVTALLGNGVPYSIIYVNSFDAGWTRRYDAVNNQLALHGDLNAVVTVGGFSNASIRVFNVSDPTNSTVITNTLIEADGNGFRVSFVPEGPTANYVVFAAGKAPISLSAYSQSDIRAATNDAQYLVITTPELRPAAQILANYRQSKGLRAKVVLLQDIYDEFNDGVANPEAIRSFLSYAAFYWHSPPGYVVLGGKGTYDYKNVKGYADNIIPPIMVGTPNGLFASDAKYADLDDDGAPEMAVGRLPAISNQELQDSLNKIAAYESTQGHGSWQSNVVMVADNADDGGDFQASSELVKRLVPGDYTVQKVYLATNDISAARSQLQQDINDGALFMNYFGHSGISQLASEGLLTVSDAGSLTNASRLPVVTAMSCVLGEFAVPGYDCLAEAMLLCKTGGAVAVWAPEGMSLNDPAETLCEGFYSAIFNSGEGILGDAVLHALRSYDASQRPKYMLSIYNLLGDPALKISGMNGAYHPAQIVGHDGQPLALSFDLWKPMFFMYDDLPAAQISGDAADPDGDGVPNFVEYAFGRNPRVADRHYELGIDHLRGADAGYDVQLTFKRLKLANDVYYIIEVSPTLFDWYDGAGYILITSVTDDGNGSTETVSAKVKSPTFSRRFGYMRLRAVQTQPGGGGMTGIPPQ